MRKLFTFSLLGLFALAAGSAHANLLLNPGFETPDSGTGAADWNEFASGLGSAVRSTAMPHSGSAHMDLAVGGAFQFAGVFQGLPPNSFTPGQTVTFTGWHKSTIDPFNGTRELKIEWNGGNPQLRVDSFVVGTEYEQFSLSGVAPPGATSATIVYALSSFEAGQGESQVYVDDFEVTVIPEPASVVLGLIGLLGLVGLVRRR